MIIQLSSDMKPWSWILLKV